ncbi:hypothetical protein BIV57_18300 [Mangrovactinospora gilvigrisea]|uniref:DUF4389 domain-containing protein n=1 Tax=Mangrovactinospora gilvigrisea TaxID=1428644 RepID=A0A1J7BBR7_9ACTN|nr:hypothetical protein BIV57_18300 [Mangrovactinospora gilvigrisea]
MPELDLTPPAHQNRLSVFFRIILLIPHILVLIVLGIGAFFVTVIGWFAALILGRLPDWIFDFLSSFLGYQVRFNTSAMLLTDRYPPFRLSEPASPEDFPARITIPRPDALNRLAVLFRIILLIPCWIVSTVLTGGWWSICIIWWIVVLIMGRSPEPLWGASTAVLRYEFRYYAYTTMLTSAYPKKIFGDAADPNQAPVSASRPLVLSSGARVLLIVIIVLGALSALTNGLQTGRQDSGGNNPYTNAAARP